MNKLRYILFDLDGTLTDPGEGINNSLQYSLKHFNIQGDPEVLAKFIGPPLTDSFQKYYHFDQKQAERAIALYREYFREHGLFANEIYPGIAPLLAALKEEDKKLAVATTKPTIFALQVLEHFDIARYFKREWVVGSYLDGRRTNKGQLIAAALQLTGAQPKDAVMVGDRKFDLIGAAENGLDAVGVTYGYGSREELEKAGALHIVDTVAELGSLLLGT